MQPQQQCENETPRDAPTPLYSLRERVGRNRNKWQSSLKAAVGGNSAQTHRVSGEERRSVSGESCVVTFGLAADAHCDVSDMWYDKTANMRNINCRDLLTTSVPSKITTLLRSLLGSCAQKNESTQSQANYFGAKQGLREEGRSTLLRKLDVVQIRHLC